MRPPRIHLAICDHCRRRIAWSSRKRQWLGFNPAAVASTRLQRRLRCPVGGGYHDPTGNLDALVNRQLNALFGVVGDGN